MNKPVYVYTDGACSGNPGPGGWGVLMKFGDKEKELYGSEKETTNNRMELTAAIQALNAIKPKESGLWSVILCTDSKYVRDGICEWIGRWKANNWKNSTNKPVKNADLWMQLDEAVKKHDVRFIWVLGHNGHVENERADKLACRGRDEAKLLSQ
jgi:ribonuclease HI